MEKTPTSGEELSEILKIIRDKFSSQTDEDIREAFILCNKHCIDIKQFELYYRPNEASEDFDLSNTVTETKITAKESAELADLSDKVIIPERIYMDCFTFSKKEIQTLPLNTLYSTINGCLMSYSSRNIIRVFNTGEFLSKMTGIMTLKKDQPYLLQTGTTLRADPESIDEIFNEFIKYLDHQAYAKNFWGQQAPHFENFYPTARNEQKERINDIPLDEKRKFVVSIFEKSMNSINTSSTADYSLLRTGVKEHAVEFLWNQLWLKWDNKDVYQ